MNKVDGNKLIAEFDGKKTMINGDGDLLLSSDNGKSWYGVLYDEDWESLMSVVDKIEDIIKPNSWYEADRTWFEIKSHSVSIRCNIKGMPYNCLWVIEKNYKKDHRENVTASKKDAVWQSATDFIKWYKQNIS